MNLALISLPLLVSLSALGASVGLYVGLKGISEKTYPIQRKELDIKPVLEAFGRVFPSYPQGNPLPALPPATSQEEPVLLGTGAGLKNLALLRFKDKTLILEEGKEKEGVKLLRVGKDWAKVRVGGSVLELRVKPDKTASAPVTERADSELRIPKRELERLTADPGIMFREIRLVPFVKDGRTEGFLFEWIKPDSLFYRAGLRPGDVLLSINNVEIRSGEDAFRLLQVLRNEPSLKVVVMRDGQRREVGIRIE